MEDANGPVSGATVQIQYNNGASSQTLSTDQNGNVEFSDQPVGIGGVVDAFLSDDTEMGSATLPPLDPGANPIINITIS